MRSGRNAAMSDVWRPPLGRTCPETMAHSQKRTSCLQSAHVALPTLAHLKHEGHLTLGQLEPTRTGFAWR
eukprot:2710341-Alexandrium_andersonii.AAC.1